MTLDEEDFIHYVECINSLNQAWNILQELGSVEKRSVTHAAAFRFALVQYSTAYTRSDGAHRRRKLAEPQLPPELIELHQQILALRDQVLAHTDLTVKQAKLHLHSFGGRPYHIIAQTSVDELPSREAVVTLIERTLDLMYVEAERRLRLLHANS